MSNSLFESIFLAIYDVKKIIAQEVENGKNEMRDFINSAEVASRMEQNMARILNTLLTGKHMDVRTAANNFSGIFAPIIKDAFNLSDSQKGEAMLDAANAAKRNF